MTTALVTGAGGQDAYYLGSLLLDKGYRVIGSVRSADHASATVEALRERGMLVIALDVRDADAISAALEEHQPDEVYNLAAHARGSTMWDEPADVMLTNGLAVTHFLEAIRLSGRPVRFCQASSSEMFGTAAHSPQSEETPFVPRSPYGAAKLYAHNMIGIYREHHGLFACSAILFNHESELRGPEFVTGKIAHYAAGIKLGVYDALSLGNVAALRDWGFAGDHMRALQLMLQRETPMDFVIATGQSHSVEDFCRLAFAHLGLDYRDYLKADEAAFRPAESVPLVGDSSLAREQLDWRPELEFEALVRLMVDSELEALSANQSTR